MGVKARQKRGENCTEWCRKSTDSLHFSGQCACFSQVRTYCMKVRLMHAGMHAVPRACIVNTEELTLIDATMMGAVHAELSSSVPPGR